jgi:hypothetical protein
MIIKCFFSVVFIFLGITALFAAEERYLCVAEKSTGFSYEKGMKRWVSTNFNVDGDKYLIMKSNAAKAKLEIKYIGQDFPICWCGKGFNEHGQAHFKCIDGEYVFNKKTNRYIRSAILGYTEGEDLFELTPFIEIGKCSTF